MFASTNLLSMLNQGRLLCTKLAIVWKVYSCLIKQVIGIFLLQGCTCFFRIVCLRAFDL